MECDEKVFCQDSDDDDNCFEKDEELENTNVLTEQSLVNSLRRNPEVGEYVLVLFTTKKQRVYYVAKIIETKNHEMEFNVCFLKMKRKSEQKFCMPDKSEKYLVSEDDLKFILPTPTVSGTAKRQSYYKFPGIDLSLLNMG
ncbi:hypothetical protein ABEB36_005132 [Hypothenemus hampei]|uniref:Uncharacterized protein n=1 Tax=Hypothenemus hampei TaxID=57062 RepID=A0ABD1E4J3_HYPHA